MSRNRFIRQVGAHWAEYCLWILALLACVEMTWLSWARYDGYNAGVFDLGIMSQSVWSATHGRPLIFTAPGLPLSRLARHVELFYFVPALIYGLLPTPKTLLIFQAALYAAAAWSVYALARRRLNHRLAALACAVFYLFYPVAQTAVLFDFHGDTLAMPLLIFALEALDRRAWKSYGLWIALALSAKFYVAAPVMALGVALWLRGERRVGMWTALAGAGWGIVAFLAIRPLFATPEAAGLYTTPGGYVRHYFELGSALSSTLGVRLLVAVIVYAPALWLGWRSPLWLLLAGATAIPTLFSNGPGPSFDYRAHHYALAVPFLVMAVVYGAERVRRRQDLFLHFGVSLLLLLMFNGLFVDSPLNPRFYRPAPGRAEGLSPLQYGVTERDAFKDRWLAQHIPAQAAIAADTLLSPHLVNRVVLYQTRPPRESEVVQHLPELLPQLDGVVVDGLLDFAVGSQDRVSAGGVLYERETVRLLLRSPEFGLAQADDGLLWFARGAAGLEQQVEIVAVNELPPLLADWGGQVGLVQVELTALGDRRFRLVCEWVALTDLQDGPPLIAVSRLRGVAHSRILHLPSYALLPTTDWPVGSVVRERIEFVLPPDLLPGRYELVLSWHEATHLYAAETDARSRVGAEFEASLLDVQP